MELKKELIGFEDIDYLYREFDLMLDQKTKQMRDSKVRKSKNQKDDEQDHFHLLFASNSEWDSDGNVKKDSVGNVNRNLVEHMIENQDDFYEYEDFYVFLKWVDVFENLDEQLDFLEQEEKINTDMRKQIMETYKKSNPRGDLVGFFE